MEREQPRRDEPRPVVVRQMPDRETLEEFLGSMVGRHSTVTFNLEKGEFVRLGKERK